MDEEKKNIIQLMLGFVRRANGDHVSAYAAQAAYFLIMSFIPFILFLTTLIRYTPLSYNNHHNYSYSIYIYSIQ